jgi:hypothetical protein
VPERLIDDTGVMQGRRQGIDRIRLRFLGRRYERQRIGPRLRRGF